MMKQLFLESSIKTLIYLEILFWENFTITGFITDSGAAYLYTGIQGQYKLGPMNILPSFAPGYYEKGDGKDMGSVHKFKSEIKIGFDIFENSNFGYTYSHISNNDWGYKPRRR